MEDLQILDHFRMRMPPDDCSYLPDEIQSLEFRLFDSIVDENYARLLERGWRRHGIHFFRPACPQCRKCRSLRIDVNTFKPTKSQRRALRRNADVTWHVREACVTPEHVELYNRYHADMHERRDWPLRQTDRNDYFESFLAGDYSFAREIVFHRDGHLIGVGLIDIAAGSASSVYFYHDPVWRDLGPGTFSLLCEIEHLRTIGGKFHYLGYWIRECPSMAYKSRFGPHELLEEYVGDTEQPVWSSTDPAIGHA